MSIPVARCYRCLVSYPAPALKPAPALCGCEHDYCESCLSDGRFAAWLRFVGSICSKVASAA